MRLSTLQNHSSLSLLKETMPICLIPSIQNLHLLISVKQTRLLLSNTIQECCWDLQKHTQVTIGASRSFPTNSSETVSKFSLKSNLQTRVISRLLFHCLPKVEGMVQQVSGFLALTTFFICQLPSRLSPTPYS